MQSTPQKQHEWLAQLVGDWTMTGECDMGPDQPKMKSSGTEKVRAMGKLWIVCEGAGEMPEGDAAEMLMTLGYDTAKEAFVGHWNGSMMSGMFVYRGALDASGKVLTLDTEGPSFTGDGTTVRYQDVITIKGPDERQLHSQALQPDGKWYRFMTATYRRVK
jgi:hypothetical protein